MQLNVVGEGIASLARVFNHLGGGAKLSYLFSSNEERFDSIHHPFVHLIFCNFAVGFQRAYRHLVNL